LKYGPHRPVKRTVMPPMAKNNNWIKKALDANPGSLHRALGVPRDQTIPKGKLDAAAKRGGKIGKKAQLLKNINGARKGK
jgi:hypothetical protein